MGALLPPASDALPSWEPRAPCVAVVTHHHHAPRWMALLEPTLECSVVCPRPKAAADFELWGLDAEGYWASPSNPQRWTRSADEFLEYEADRLDVFSGVARRCGPLWSQRTWDWCSPPVWAAGRMLVPRRSFGSGMPRRMCFGATRPQSMQLPLPKLVHPESHR